MARFHPLTVTGVTRETRDAVAVTLRPAPADRQAFAFTQGQYLTFRRDFDGVELRRSYSICAGVDDADLRVGIKRVDGGTFSTWANTSLKPGDTVEAMVPMGRFFTALDPAASRHYLAFAAGSGITPVLSILKTTLTREPLSTFTLVYANRQAGSILFREELEDLKNLHLGRLSILHVLGSDGQEIDLFSGRIDAAKMDALFRLWIDPTRIDTAFICGPEGFRETVDAGLRRNGISRDRIKSELFAAAQQGRAAAPAPSQRAAGSGQTCEIEVQIDGTRHRFQMAQDGGRILDAALAHDTDAPFACKAGVCSTCRAKVIEGEVEMQANHALEDYEVRAGYVLSCQSVPLSPRVVLSYDE